MAAQERELPDGIIDAFLSLTEGYPAPEIFRLFGGLFLVSTAMSRRLYATGKLGRIYPGQFIALCGESGVGKGPVIGPVNHFLREIDYSTEPENSHRGIRMAGEKVTIPGLIRFLGAQRSKKIVDLGRKEEFCNAVIISEEAGTFLQPLSNPMTRDSYGAFLIAVLNADPIFRETLRGADEEITYLENISGSILAGLQPSKLLTYFPIEVWQQGLAARVIFVHSNEINGQDLFFESGEEEKERKRRDALSTAITHDLKILADLGGEIVFSDEARAAFNKWWMKNNAADAPKHPMLKGYGNKRNLHMARLCMAISASRDNNRVVTKTDFEIAHSFLLSAEKSMEGMFEHTIAAESDEAVLLDIAHKVKTYCEKHGGRPVPERELRNNIGKRVKMERVIPLIQAMRERKLIKRVDLGIPLPGGEKLWGYIPCNEVTTL